MNLIELAKQYVATLMEVYGKASLTAILENNALVQMFAGAMANEVKLPKMDMSGLGNYNRSTGYPKGNVSLTFETRKLEKDRGRQFNVDAMDDFESQKVVMANLLSSFVKTQVIPEIDAYRFSVIAQGAGQRATGTLATADAVKSAINNASVSMDEKGVPAEGRVLFVTPTILNLLKDGINRFVQNGEGNIKREIVMYDGMEVVAVPQSRFCLGCQLNEDGFETEGSALNFMIVHKDAVIPVIKHNPMRIFAPEQNQDADAYKVDYRVYHDIFVRPNYENGIYCHSVADTRETVDTPVLKLIGDKTSSVKFTAETKTDGASLYYTLDGTTPTASSTAYTGEVTLTDTASAEKTIKVIGIKAGQLDSKVVSKVAHIVV